MDRSWEDVDFRTYRHIFTDGNTSSPGDNIGLGYTSPYLEMTFNPGEDTVFHFPVVPKDFEYGDDPRYTSGISINDSGLIENGAIPGRAPYCSDRVYLNNVDYEWKDAGGGARPKNMVNGVWLCAWLSGDVSDMDSARWVDRWYDPSLIDARAAGTARAGSDGVYDTDSRITFRYGCQYIYHRVSREDFEFFVDAVDSSGLILRINDWTSAGCYNSAPRTSGEFTIRMNNATPDMFGVCEVVPDSGDTGISFNGKSSVTVDSASGNQQGLEFSVVSFIQHNDWANSTKGAIIDRGIRGGWEIGVSPTPYNNLICVLGTEKQTNMNSISIYGPSFNLISTAKFSEGNKVIRVAVDDDYGIWGLRKSDIVRIDINANVTQSCPLPSDMPAYMVRKKLKMENVTLQVLGGDLYGKMAVICGPASVKSSDGKSETANDDTRVYIFDLTKCEFDNGFVSASDDKFEGMDVSTGYKGINGLVSNTAMDGCSSWMEKDSRFKLYRRQCVTDVDDELLNLNKLVLDDDELPFDVKVDADYNIFVMTKKYKVIDTDRYGNPIFYYSECSDLTSNIFALSPGWNVISFDQLPEDRSPENVFKAISESVGRVICGSGSWIPGKTGGTIDKIEFGKAYRVFIKGAEEIDFIIDWENTDPGVEITCESGWTLIGYPLSDDADIMSVMEDVLNSEKITKISTYDGSSMWGVEGGKLNRLERGKAYWVYSNGGCKFSFYCKRRAMTKPIGDGRCEVIGGRLLKFIKDRDGHFYQRKIVELPVSAWSLPAGMVISSYSKNGKNVTVVNAVMTDGYIVRFSTELQRMWTTNISYYSENIHTVVNGYEWGRRFLNNVLYARALIGPNSEVLLNPGRRFLLTAPIERDASDTTGHSKGLSNRDWHQVAFIRDKEGFKLYLDSTEVDSATVDDDEKAWGLMYVANPNIVIGGDCGVGAELYEEHNMMDLFWDGNMDDLRIYGMAVTPQDLQHIHMSKYDVQPLHWNMPVYNRFYVETIARFYKMKKPGSKSQNYDIVINGYVMDKNSDEFVAVKSEIGEYVKGALKEISPAHTKGGRVIFGSHDMNGGWNGEY